MEELKKSIKEIVEQDIVKVVISNKKDKDESVVSKENNNAEDKKEEVKETESNINMPENSTSSNDININNTNKNNSQSSSSNANSNTSNNNSSNTSSNTNSNTSSNTNSNTSSNSWNPIIEQVHHDEVGHWEDVVVTPAWTESIPVYEEREVAICNGCGADITSNIDKHMTDNILAGNMACTGWHTDYKQIQVGTNNVNHPAVTEKKWVVDKAAWTETVTVGHSCSCGATK